MRQRLQQQIDRERETARGELARERAEIAREREATGETKAKYDRLAARAESDPLGVLEEMLGDKLDIEHIGRQAWLRVNGAKDPRYKEEAARMKADKELREEVAKLKKQQAEAREADAKAKKEAEHRDAQSKMLDGIAASATKIPKATLTQIALKNDPGFAKAMIAEAYIGLWNRDGAEPTDPRAVVLAAEKLQRAHLRRYGVDHRTLTAGAERTSAKSQTAAAKTSGKVANGKANGKVVRPADDDELRMPTREELLAEDWSS
jgi:hypothetical protein